MEILTKENLVGAKAAPTAISKDLHSLTKGNQFSLVRIHFSHPRIRWKLVRSWGWGSKRDPDITLQNLAASSLNLLVEDAQWDTSLSMHLSWASEPEHFTNKLGKFKGPAGSAVSNASSTFASIQSLESLGWSIVRYIRYLSASIWRPIYYNQQQSEIAIMAAALSVCSQFGSASCLQLSLTYGCFATFFAWNGEFSSLQSVLLGLLC